MRASQGINGVLTAGLHAVRITARGSPQRVANPLPLFVQSGSGAGLQIRTIETVTQTMTRTGVGGGDLSGTVDDSRE
jgi:hypothetical protein